MAHRLAPRAESRRDSLWSRCSFSNFGPVFIANIGVNLGGNVCGIKRIIAILSRAGNPVFIASNRLVVISLESTTLETVEFLVPILDRGPRLGKCHASYPGGARKFASLAFDVHDLDL